MVDLRLADVGLISGGQMAKGSTCGSLLRLRTSSRPWELAWSARARASAHGACACDRPRRTMWGKRYQQGGWDGGWDDDKGYHQSGWDDWKNNNKCKEQQGPDNRSWAEKYTYLNGPAKAAHTLPVEDRCWLVREIASIAQKGEQDALRIPIVRTLSWPADIVDAVLFLMTGAHRPTPFSAHCGAICSSWDDFWNTSGLVLSSGEA